MTVEKGVNAAADLALAAAAIWVSFTALRGRLMEQRARKAQDAGDKVKWEADAKLLYVSASLQKPSILLLVFVGSVAKLALTVWPLLWGCALMFLSRI